MTMLIGCMVATNAAEAIELSLGSLHPIVDELVLVDGGSTDRTKAIATSFGATVIESKRRDNYAAQRQVYLVGQAASETSSGRLKRVGRSSLVRIRFLARGR